MGRAIFRRAGRAVRREGRREGHDFVVCCVGNDNDLRRTLAADGACLRHEKARPFVDHTNRAFR